MQIADQGEVVQRQQLAQLGGESLGMLEVLDPQGAARDLERTAKDALTKLLGPSGEDVASKITYSNDIKNMIFNGAGSFATEQLTNNYTDYEVAITNAEAALGSGSGG